MPGRGGSHPNKETLSAFADRELPVAERVRVERHLFGCARCRGLVEQFADTRNQVQRLRAHRVPVSMNRNMWRRIERADEHRRRLGWLPLPLPSANMVGLLITALLIVALAPRVMTLFLAFASRSHAVHLAAPVPDELPLASPVAVALSTVPPTAPAIAPSPAVGTTTTTASATTSASPPLTATAGTTVAVQYRVITGQVAAVNRSQRTIGIAEASTKVWQFGVSDGTLYLRKDGQKLGFEDVGLGDQVEVTGFETLTTANALMASQVKVLSSVVQTNQAPHVLVLLDGADGLRAPQYGFTGDWIKRLNDTGYTVTAKDPSSLTGAASLKGVDLIVIGYPATLPNAALQAVRASKLPVLVGDPRLVQPLGLGQNLDPAQPVRMVQGRSVDIPPQAGLVTRGFSGETEVANDTLYRTPIVANGTVLATVADGGQKVTVWSVTGTSMYFGFWYSSAGQNHNGTYWTLFDRSVLFLLDKNPLGTTSSGPGK